MNDTEILFWDLWLVTYRLQVKMALICRDWLDLFDRFNMRVAEIAN